MAPPKWRVRLGSDAEADLAAILQWTADAFGPAQTHAYRDVLVAAVRALEHGPDPIGSRQRDEIGAGLRTLHVARHGRRGRHLLLYRVAHGSTIEVIRILHDSMELWRHVPSGPGESED
jgi:toxin ParE1/3/4